MVLIPSSVSAWYQRDISDFPATALAVPSVNCLGPCCQELQTLVAQIVMFDRQKIVTAHAEVAFLDVTLGITLVLEEYPRQRRPSRHGAQRRQSCAGGTRLRALFPCARGRDATAPGLRHTGCFVIALAWSRVPPPQTMSWYPKPKQIV